MNISNLTTNEVLFIVLGVWSLGFWIAGWVANKRRNERYYGEEDKAE